MLTCASSITAFVLSLQKWKNAIAPRMQESNRIRQLQQEHEEGIRLAETKALTGIEIET